MSLDDLREDWNEQNQLFISDYSKVCFGGAFKKYGRVINFQFALDSVLRPPIFSVSLFCGLYNAGDACPPQLYLVGTDSFDKKTRFEDLTDDRFFEIESKPNEEHFKVIAVDPGDTRLIHGVTNKVILSYFFNIKIEILKHEQYKSCHKIMA